MIDISFEPGYENSEAEAIITYAVNAALEWENAEGSVAVYVCGDEEIHEMNLLYRSIDRPTDVLSFPASEGEQNPAEGDFLGDIAISLDKAETQAIEYGHSFKRELTFLTLHGTLHLLGYDHIEEDDRKVMFSLQNKILEKMGIER